MKDKPQASHVLRCVHKEFHAQSTMTYSAEKRMKKALRHSADGESSSLGGAAAGGHPGEDGDDGSAAAKCLYAGKVQPLVLVLVVFPQANVMPPVEVPVLCLVTAMVMSRGM